MDRENFQQKKDDLIAPPVIYRERRNENTETSQREKIIQFRYQTARLDGHTDSLSFD